MSHVVALKAKPPAGRSPERQALAETQAAITEATKRLAGIKAAIERAEASATEAFQAVKRSRVALDEAKAGERQFLVAAALGEVGAGDNPVKRAEEMLSRSEAAYDDGNKLVDALRGAEEGAERELNSLRSNLANAVRLVVKSDPATTQLVHDYQIAQKTYLDLCKLLAALGELGCCPVNGTVGEGYSPQFNTLSQGTAPLAPAWLASIAALRTDADAALSEG